MTDAQLPTFTIDDTAASATLGDALLNIATVLATPAVRAEMFALPAVTGIVALPPELTLPMQILPFFPVVEGKPRDQIAVPLAPAMHDDQQVFDSASGTPFFLPRYRVATEQVILTGGGSRTQFQLALQSDAGGGTLTAVLEAYPAPALANRPDLTPMPHTIGAVLRYTIPGGGAQEEIAATEIAPTATQATIRFRVDHAAKFAQLAAALSETAYLPQLVITRTAQIAIPTSQAPEPPLVSAGEATIRGTWLFDFDTGTEGTGGDIWWNQQTQTERALVPQAGAQLALIGAADFDSVTFAQMQALPFSTAPIDGSVKLVSRHFAKNRLIAMRPRGPFERDLSMPFRRRDPIGEPIIPIDDLPPAEPVEVPTGQLRDGVIFAVLTDGGNIAKVQVRQYGYNLGIRWATYRRPTWPPGTQLYTETDWTVTDTPDPRPFVFPRDLHPNIYRAIGGGTPRYGLIQRTVNWNGQQHSYYQDEAQPHVFRYLPDRFAIARMATTTGGQVRSVPWLRLSYVGDADHLEAIEARLDYHAAPQIEQQRLIEAAVALRAMLPPQAPSIVFEPLLTAPDSTRLLLKRPGQPLEHRANASIDVRAGISDMLALPIGEFPALYAALLSSDAAFLDGHVEIVVGNVTERIPLLARLSATVGPVLALTPDADGRFTITNITESPLLIPALPATRASVVTSLIPDETLPLTLPAGAQLRASGPAGEGELVLDQRLIQPLPDPTAVLRAITASIGPAFTRNIHVQTTASTFAPPADATTQITHLIINFATGGSITLHEGMLAGDVRVSFPISDFVLSQVLPNGQTQMNSYTYKLTIIRAAAPLTEETRTSTDTTLVVG